MCVCVCVCVCVCEFVCIIVCAGDVVDEFYLRTINYPTMLMTCFNMLHLFVFTVVFLWVFLFHPCLVGLSRQCCKQ